MLQVESEPNKALKGEFVPVQSELIIDLTENKDNAANEEIEVPAPPPGDTTWNVKHECDETRCSI